MSYRKTPTDKGEGGFVLASVIFVVALLGVLAVTTVIMTGDERQAAHGIREGTRAFYAAEAGMNEVIATFDSLEYDTLMTAPGDSLDLGWVTLSENGTSYRAVIHRVDNGGPAIYSLHVEARTAGGGQREMRVALTSGSGGTIDLDGAFQFGGNAKIGKGGLVTVDGNDNIPPGWEGVCPPPGPAKPGLSIADVADITFQGSPTIMGNPPIVETPFDTLAFDVLYASLVAQADIVFPPGLELRNEQIQPVENPPGVCDTSVPTNWGAPEDPTHPCFDYFPIVYVPGGVNFKTQPDHAGQGILLTDASSQLENGFSWYGLMMALDDVQVEQGQSGCAPANIYGGLYTRNNSSSTKLEGAKPNCPPGTIGSSLFYSSCAMQRIGAGGASGGIVPVRGSWTELW